MGVLYKGPDISTHNGNVDVKRISRALKWVFWLRSDPSKVVVIPNHYLII